MTHSPLAPNLAATLDELMPAAERLCTRRRVRARRARSALLATTVLALTASVAVAALDVLGRPAPAPVKQDLRDVDAGLPRDLRLNPDVEHARSVAVAGDSVVYFAALAGGGYCAELVTEKGRPRGAVCSTRAQVDSTPLSVTVPFTDPVTDASPVSVSGHASVAAARSVELVYPDGATGSVPIGARGFYVAEVPSAHLASVHRHGLMLIARDGDGRAVAEAVVPTDAISPPAADAAPHDPIEIDTVSDERDLTLVLRVRGELHVEGAVRMTLEFPDGRTVAVPLHGPRFDYAVPTARRRELMTPGKLAAYGPGGRLLATRPVAAVAYWHGRERERGRK